MAPPLDPNGQLAHELHGIREELHRTNSLLYAGLMLYKGSLEVKIPDEIGAQLEAVSAGLKTSADALAAAVQSSTPRT